MFGLHVDRQSALSIARQLCAQLRQRILGGALPAGTRLPPTRALAAELGIARNTVLQVYDQLIAEGYLAGHVGSGTYVVDLAAEQRADREPALWAEPAWPLSAAQADGVIRFDAGMADYRQFPRAAWALALREACVTMPEQSFVLADPQGDPALRQAICAYLYRAKGIECSPEEVLITPGATGGVDGLAHVLRSKGSVAVVEDPCLHFIRNILLRDGYALKGVPVDAQGMRADMLDRIQDARLIYTTPSHQFPTGHVLSIRRRLELLRHARRCGAWIIEDDYDSEFRYVGEPIQSLRHLDPERVVYLGSFSKTFSSTLRIGYLIAPPEILDATRRHMESVNQSAPAAIQRALASFLADGQFERHLYRMKKLYARKRQRLIDELRRVFGAAVTIRGDDAGMHLLALFEGVRLQQRHFDRLHQFGVEADWTWEYALDRQTCPNGMILGYGALTPEETAEGVRRIKLVLQEG